MACVAVHVHRPADWLQAVRDREQLVEAVLLALLHVYRTVQVLERLGHLFQKTTELNFEARLAHIYVI